MPARRFRWIALAVTVVAGAITVANTARGAERPQGVAGDADFAAALFADVGATNRGNVFVSPFSVRSALAMTAEGARGETARQMTAALRLPAGVGTAAAFGRLIAGLMRDSGPVFTVESGVWIQAGVPFERPFLSACTGEFGSTAELADFTADPEAERLKINAWATAKTHDRVLDLLPPGAVDVKTRMVLANAVYFKGDWARKFDPDSTRDRPFHFDASTEAPVKMMTRSVDAGTAYDSATVSAIDLAYTGAKTSLLIVVPKAVDGLPAVERALTGDQLRTWVSKLRATDVDLSLPRFKAAGHYALKASLVAMGMALPFDRERADFSGIRAGPSEARLCIGDVLHGSFVTVGEDGTEAAAATAVTMPLATCANPSSPKPKRLDIVADRPFLYILRDRPTGTILFIGRCSDPRL